MSTTRTNADQLFWDDCAKAAVTGILANPVWMAEMRKSGLEDKKNVSDRIADAASHIATAMTDERNLERIRTREKR